MRLGMMLAGGGGMTVADMVHIAVQAEKAGVDGVYLPEAWRSGFVPLTAMAAATERIELGPYVLNAHSRTPWLTGLAAVDLDEFSRGRLVLGVGSGNRVTNESYQGVAVDRPLGKMRDYVAVLREVTTTGLGESAEYRGERHSTSGWHSQVQPVRAEVPIVVAATAPRMTALAAEVADGIALGSLQGTGFVSEIAEQCRSRAPRPFRVMGTSFVSVADDSEAARDGAREAVVNLYAGKPHPHYDSLLRQQGFAAEADAVIEAVAADERARALGAVTDRMVDELTVAGTPEECRARISEYSAVLDDLILVNVAGMRYQAGATAVGGAGDQLLGSFTGLLELVRS